MQAPGSSPGRYTSAEVSELLAALTAALRHRHEDLATATFRVCSSEWFCEAMTALGQEVPTDLLEAVSAATVAKGKSGSNHKAVGPMG